MSGGALKRPLDGIKVLDLSRVLAGPYCTMTLGDLGAEVWKVEHPRGGDDTRTWRPPEAGGESTYYLCTNRNKRSVAIDLKTAEGQAILQDLASRADVLVENMRHGTLEGVGLGWDAVHALNPRLIYCSISGYGRDSPRAKDPGYDAVIQAESGLMSFTGTEEGGPMKHGVAVTDIVSGMSATQAILAALIARGRTGEGQFIDIALLDCALALLANIGSGWLNAGAEPRRFGNEHPTVVPYGIFPAADGEFVLGCGNDRQFRATCVAALERPDIADDPRFARNQDRQRNRDGLVPLLRSLFLARPVEHWVKRLMAADVPAAVVRTVPQALTAPEVVARGVVWTVPHPRLGSVSTVGSPLRLQGMQEPATPPPLLAEHTREVLGAVLGKTDDEIDALIQAGAVAVP